MTDDFACHLALQMGLSGYNGDKILISSDTVNFSIYEEDEMNTVRKVLLLLVVGVSNYSNEALAEKRVVLLPEESYISWLEQSEWWDLFGDFPITTKVYCLQLAYNILTKKLPKRNTPLFRILYICTCLELWRLDVPPEVIVWPAWKDVHWWNVILNLTGNFSQKSSEKFTHAGFGSFIEFLKKEVENISVNEIPENILRHFYEQNWIWVRKEQSLVQKYLSQIMRESKTISTQSPPSA